MQASRSTITDAHSSRREKKNAPHTPLRRKDYILSLLAAAAAAKRSY
nr:MAG TPA: hypothetical protein [Caudoviricetes sp.]